MGTNNFTVRPGDIFRDNDVRMSGRHVKVVSADSRHAYVINCAPDGGRATGRKTRVSLRGLETRFERVGGSTQLTGVTIPPAVLDLLRWLANCCMVQQHKRHEAIALPPEECREFVAMKWPIVQGMRNQMALEEIGKQPIDSGNFNEAIEWLLANPPAADLRRARDGGGE